MDPHMGKAHTFIFGNFSCKVRCYGIPFMFSSGTCDKLVVPHMVMLVALLVWKNLYNGTIDYRPY